MLQVGAKSRGASPYVPSDREQMAFENGVSDWRVYSAEHAVGHDEKLDAGGAVATVERATSSDWWAAWFPHSTPIEVVIGGRESVESEGGHRWSFAGPKTYPKPTGYLISIHPEMLTARVLLHELAHCVAPHFIVEELEQYSDFPIESSRRRHRSHGSFFTATLSLITDNMLPGDDGQLAAAYKHFEVPIASQEELRQQLLGQPEAEDAQQAFWDETRRESEERRAEHLAKTGEPLRELVPTMDWGFNLHIMRKEHHRRVGGRMLSMKKLAEEISAVTPCTAKHISELEHAKKRPEDPAQLKRAMSMTIYLGMDPIWVRYNLWLTRWDCGGITLKDARVLNPGWAKLVSKMNRQLKQMPPRWVVEGER